MNVKTNENLIRTMRKQSADNLELCTPGLSQITYDPKEGHWKFVPKGILPSGFENSYARSIDGLALTIKWTTL